MASFREYRRRSIIPLAGAVLVGVYLFYFLPTDRRARELDNPLRREWRALTASLGDSNAVTIDFLNITNRLDQTKRSLGLIRGTRETTVRLLALDPGLREKLAEGSFQLIDYQIATSQRKDALASLAKKEKVALDPSVLIGFPEYTVEVAQPELLWAYLSMVNGLLTGAIQAKVTAIHSLSVPTVLTNLPNSFTAREIVELPFQVEMTGPVKAVTKLLEALPLRGPEAGSALGVADALKDKPPLFLERLVIKKQTPEQPDEVRVMVRVIGFVLRE